LPITPGPFQPTAESLKQYQYPKWFRDAKFGIWGALGAASSPMDGDWYARLACTSPATVITSTHLEHYGHPSEFGYKDIIPLWKAEKWDPRAPDATLYKDAGREILSSAWARITTTSSCGTRCCTGGTRSTWGRTAMS